jgi:hypothetical protein
MLWWPAEMPIAAHPVGEKFLHGLFLLDLVFAHQVFIETWRQNWNWVRQRVS